MGQAACLPTDLALDESCLCLLRHLNVGNTHVEPGANCMYDAASMRFSILRKVAWFRRLAWLAVIGGAALVSSCAGARTGGGDSVASEATWRSLAAPRPNALPGTARVSVGDVRLIGELSWNPAARISPELAVAELVAAGLLRRRDVHFVERRRFTAAAAAERAGARPRGAPAAGVSPGAEFIATAVWLPLAPGQNSVEIRLATPTGAIAGSARVALRDDDDPVTIARSIVTALLAALDNVSRLPAWEDPIAGAGGTMTGSEVLDPALQSFLRGLAAEESWDWEGARRGYQAAASDPGFFEAPAALARAARLRLGGTLGEG